ncbi:DUF2782 domain-containing protein [Candidatus Thiodictyon syntrophicum]|uniref:DUF2782 domain-containing protein n=1 Tax=Candidatus Thiodictyon syntrophicum TaxID=1166950 RepID=A0A2K8U5L6_9GAMM|nr:DUF2782 domain-containing protein [Candidatus Thiodictyon syntrophicum]AUB80331.1 hypothetical protein THSYN_04765 [Candidatus Thiodictyon syntrophicum]
MKFFAAPALLLLACALPVLAEDPPPPPATPPAPGAGGFLESPSVAPSPVTGDPVEPEITIREGANETIYEYRVRGRLYMTKIQPQIGPAYYLIDSNGDGSLDQRSSIPMDINVNQWLLFSWD